MRTSYWKNELERYKSDTTRFVLPTHSSLFLHFFRRILSNVLQWNKSTAWFARDEKHSSRSVAMCSTNPVTRMNKQRKTQYFTAQNLADPYQIRAHDR